MVDKASEALLYAAERGCLQGVKAALKAGADIDYAQPDNEVTGKGTALFIASYFRHTDIMTLLIRKGASMTKRTTMFASAPLHGAVTYEGKTDALELLFRHGATLDIRDCYQRTPLMLACMFGYVDTVRKLIQLGARVDLKDTGPTTAQMYCEKAEEGGNCSRAQKETMVKLIQEARLRCCNPTCGKPGDRSTLKLCGQCKLTRYCSRDCQKQHWTVGHKKSCGHDGYSEPSPLKKLWTSGRIFDFMTYVVPETS
ncbi:PREDICTED: kinase D-interacting substrate of 220 kDa-like [Branchiostoma belcheri]|uniref:Kinase D-interacting substrate of 220 kDa-like n=1 Tax=Branchiostoma belcheri TaxID=7741 RepID=A0A6P4ZDL9_BRABE|nr:PREDICTED: kinase D-interacting substrate of 220 kDa-like [Branchiostoma belcheri]